MKKVILIAGVLAICYAITKSFHHLMVDNDNHEDDDLKNEVGV